MKESTSKEKILKKIRTALPNMELNPIVKSTVRDEKYFPDPPDDLRVVFAENFVEAGGKFIYCESEEDFIDQLKSLYEMKGWKNIFAFEKNIKNVLEYSKIEFDDNPENLINAKVGITRCESIIARTGSVVLSSKMNWSRGISATPDVHVVIALKNQLVFDLKDSLDELKSKYGEKNPSAVSFVTGPGKTADIERKVVNGGHGPKEIYLFFIDNNE